MFSDQLAGRHIDSANFEVTDKADFLRDFAHRSRTADVGSHIIAMTMAYDTHDPLVAECLDAMTTAAYRGADVSLFVDAYAFMDSHDTQPLAFGPLFYGTDLASAAGSKPVFRKAYEALESLRRAGGHYTITNLPDRRFSLPIAGRSHIKLYMIDDRVSLGGCNLDDSSHIDPMLSWHDEPLSHTLQTFCKDLADESSVRMVIPEDMRFAVDDVSQLLFDSGQRGQSAILEQAVSMIDAETDSVFITGQYFLGGAIAAALRRADRRGAQVHIAYNHPAKNGSRRGLQYISQAIEKMRNPARFFADRLPMNSPFLHAKLLATSQGFMLGSHNYVQAGVQLGTAEICLLRRDPVLGAQLVDMVKRQAFSAQSQLE